MSEARGAGPYNRGMPARHARWLIVLGAGLVAGCFDSPNYEGRLCSEVDPCPGELICSTGGVCEHPGALPRVGVADAPPADAAVDPAPLTAPDAGPARPTPSVPPEAGADGDAGMRPGKPDMLDAGAPTMAPSPDAGATGLTEIANSVTDFSGTQGANGWSYGYVAPNGANRFTAMTQFANSAWSRDPNAYWTMISATMMKPNSGIHTSGGKVLSEEWPVRRWTSTVQGVVTISLHIAKAEIDPRSNGVLGGVFVDIDNTQAPPIWSQSIAGGDSQGLDARLQVNVSVGTKLDFALNPNGDDTNDMTTYTVLILK